jgi:hypothetical protein
MFSEISPWLAAGFKHSSLLLTVQMPLLGSMEDVPELVSSAFLSALPLCLKVML